MAKDDFHVIVYQILSYLYQCLKKGKPIDPKMLTADSVLFKVKGQELNVRYWGYIVYNMQRMGLIEGVDFVDLVDNLKYPHPYDLTNCMITPLGIEYLSDNSFIQKAKEFLQDVNSIIPFP